MDQEQLDVLCRTVETLRRLLDGLLQSQGRVEVLEHIPEIDTQDHLDWQNHQLSLISMLGLGLSALADGDPDRCTMVAEQIEGLPTWDN